MIGGQAYLFKPPPPKEFYADILKDEREPITVPLDYGIVPNFGPPIEAVGMTLPSLTGLA